MINKDLICGFARKYQMIKNFAKKYLEAAPPVEVGTKDVIGDFAGKYRFIVHVVLPTGIVKELFKTKWHHNLITKDGRTLLLNLMKPGSGVVAPGYLAVGAPSSVNAPTLDDHALQSETARVAITSATVTTSIGTYNITYEASATADLINGIKEVGVLNASSSGTLVARSTFATAISGMPPGTIITIQYQISMITSTIITNWTKYGANYTYNTPLTAGIDVQSVIETDTKNGYQLVGSAAACESTPNSYYFGGGSLYVRCSGTTIPSAHVIAVQSGG